MQYLKNLIMLLGAGFILVVIVPILLMFLIALIVLLGFLTLIVTPFMMWFNEETGWNYRIGNLKMFTLGVDSE